MTSKDTTTQSSADAEQGQDEASAPKAPPIQNRFLFVDVAALRAKQLKRGALPRLGVPDPPVAEDDTDSDAEPDADAGASERSAVGESDEAGSADQPREGAEAADLIVVGESELEGADAPRAPGRPQPPKPERKLERIAMQEVEAGLIVYTLPDPSEPEEGAA